MSLGKRISALRAEKRLSQGDLAEMLEVSRQSVSKWETDSSIPDLDKLIKLSEVFCVSLDELVKGEKKPEPAAEMPPPQTQQVVVIQKGKTPKNVAAAWMFFGLAALVFLAIALLGSLGGLIYAIPFVILGCICLIVKKYTGVAVAWTLYLMVDAFFLVATGIRWGSIRYTFQWTEHMNYLRLAFAWVLFFMMIALLIYTLWTFRKVPFEFNKKNALILLVGWMAFFLLRISIPPGYYVNGWIYYLANVREWIRFGLLTWLLSRSIAFVRRRKA